MEEAGTIPLLGVGVMGYGFAARAHISAFKRIQEVYWPPPAVARSVGICGRTEDRIREAAARYDVPRWYTRWEKMLEDPDIQIFDNCGTNDAHAESCIRAAETGRHVICEKPLARSAQEAGRMLEAVVRSGVKHMCGFNYRFVPAVRLAKELIDGGVIGEIRHFNGRYAVDRAMDPNIPLRWMYTRERAGSGALGLLGSHLIDLMRFLTGEPVSVMAQSRTFIKTRKALDGDTEGPVTVDDAVSALIEFKNGAIGNLETSRFCPGRKNQLTFEINGSMGSILFDLERMNHLSVYLVDEPVSRTTGFHDIVVTDADHPYFRQWWPTGHTLGWEHTFIHEMHHFLQSVAADAPIAPWGATFEDGYRNAVICDAMLTSGASGKRVDIVY